MEQAKEHYTKALDMAYAQGQEDLAAEINERLVSQPNAHIFLAICVHFS
jgi:hypothetical protein